MNASDSAIPRGDAATRLNDLVGRWRTSGHLVADPGTRITGTDTYEWIPLVGHLAHYVDVTVGDQPVRAFELLTVDSSTGIVTARSFDEAGNMEVMTAEVDAEGTWTFRGGPEIASAAAPSSDATPESDAATAVRAILRPDPAAGRMTALWQRLTPDGWADWMDMQFTDAHTDGLEPDAG